MKTVSRYQALLNSPLHHISDPEKLDYFWAELSDRANLSWYLRDFHEDLPGAPVDELDVQEFIIRADALLHKSLKLGTALIVETDNTRAPTLIKIHSDVSLNGKSSEDWTLSLDSPASVSSPDDSVLEKGGPLLRGVSSQTDTTDESAKESANERIAPDKAEIQIQTPASVEPTVPDLALPEPVPASQKAAAAVHEALDPAASESSQHTPTQPSIEIASRVTDDSVKLATAGYLERFDGRLVAIRKWEDLDILWAGVHGTAGEGWFVYTIGEQPPTEAEGSQTLHKFLLDVDQTLRHEHKHDYCGIVYADDPVKPHFIKIYDPQNLGMVCGTGETRTLPGWTLSRVQPVELVEDPDKKANKSGFLSWKGIFKKRR